MMRKNYGWCLGIFALLMFLSGIVTYKDNQGKFRYYPIGLEVAARKEPTGAPFAWPVVCVDMPSADSSAGANQPSGLLLCRVRAFKPLPPGHPQQLARNMHTEALLEAKRLSVNPDSYKQVLDTTKKLEDGDYEAVVTY